MPHRQFPHCGLCTPNRMCSRHLRIVKTIAATRLREKKEREQ